MISLHPDGGDEPIDVPAAVAAEDRRPMDAQATLGRPWVLTNMIASADGATAVGGLSGPLGGPADKSVFGALRAVADAIVVGASTVREEGYRAPTGGNDRLRAMRAERGQEERPLVAVITASLSLDPDLPLFADPTYRPLVVTVDDAPAERRQAIERVADVVTTGTGRVDLGSALAELGRRGHRVVLAEGGPSLNGQLIADDLIDEWNLTLSPLLAGGTSSRPATGADLVPPGLTMSLARVWLEDDLLFCRWVRRTRA